MNITKENFFWELPRIKAAIDDATFIAIKCEFSGFSPDFIHSPMETNEKYYGKIYDYSKQYLVIQFGLTAFRYETETSTFREQTYIFSIFPHSTNPCVPEANFMCQGITLDILSRRGFNFNNLFSKGLSYMNVSAQAVFHQRHICPCVISQLVYRSESKCAVHSKLDIADVMRGRSSFFQRLMHYTIEFMENQELTPQQTEEVDTLLYVAKHDETSMTFFDFQELQDALGFSLVIRYLSESRKLIVGHNMLPDLCQMVEKFCTVLPKEYGEFKRCAHALFPRLLDTKHLGSHIIFTDLFPSSDLLQMALAIQRTPSIIPTIKTEDNFPPRYCSYQMHNNVAYSAYTAGACYITMWNCLNLSNFPEPIPCYESTYAICEHFNRLYKVFSSPWDAPYVQLDGPDPIPVLTFKQFKDIVENTVVDE